MNRNISDFYNAIALQSELFGDDLLTTKELMKRKSKEHITVAPDLKTAHPAGFQNAESLETLFETICNCKVCPLGETRNKFVYGTGNPEAKVMLVGEGPGADEDMQGVPFVGRAGKLLTDILSAIKFERSEVYIANIVKCRPPGNRTPVAEEIDACFPYLKKQIELISPKLILCLGTTAANALLGKKETLGKMRNNVFEFMGTQVMVTYHPAALLRNPAWKHDCWADVQAFRALYDKLG